jgi:hypothetical protein
MAKKILLKIHLASDFIVIEGLPMPDQLDIQNNANSPKRVKGDAAEVEQHSLADQIAADRYLASKRAAKAKGLGIRITQISHPGAM